MSASYVDPNTDIQSGSFLDYSVDTAPPHSSSSQGHLLAHQRMPIEDVRQCPGKLVRRGDRPWTTGEHLHHLGEHHHQAIAAGWAARWVSGPDGRLGYAGLLGPGDLMPIQHEGVRGDTWHAVQALTDLALVALPNFWVLGQAFRATQQQLICSEARVYRLSAWGVKKRLAFEIHELADRAGRECAGGVVVDLLRQDQWALLVGASLVSVARALSELADSNAIVRRRNEIVVTDSAYLADLISEY